MNSLTCGISRSRTCIATRCVYKSIIKGFCHENYEIVGSSTGLVYVTLVSAAYAAAGETPRVNRVQMEIAEKGLDATLQRLTPDYTSTLIGPSRGVYLEGVGVVLTAEVILVNAPVGSCIRFRPRKKWCRCARRNSCAFRS